MEFPRWFRWCLRRRKRLLTFLEPVTLTVLAGGGSRGLAAGFSRWISDFKEWRRKTAQQQEALRREKDACASLNA